VLTLVLQQVTSSVTTFGTVYSPDITEVVTALTLMDLLWLNDDFDFSSLNVMLSG
jgi:hypothetical protein